MGKKHAGAFDFARILHSKACPFLSYIRESRFLGRIQRGKCLDLANICVDVVETSNGVVAGRDGEFHIGNDSRETSVILKGGNKTSVSIVRGKQRRPIELGVQDLNRVLGRRESSL